MSVCRFAAYWGRAAALVALLLTTAIAPANAQSDTPDQAAIRAALNRWTDAFNAGNADGTCALFAPDLQADVRGLPRKRDYAEQCAMLRRSLADRTRSYAYDKPAIHEIVVDRDMAIVRLTWTLRVKRKGTKQAAVNIEPGLDVFKRQPDGSWKIMRYMSFDAK
jgi:steroid delta-isomerase